MIELKSFEYQPLDHENEKATNAYIMSLIALMVGLPLPIINLIATFIFYLGNRKNTHYVRWHSTQALLSQISLFLINAVGFTWTIRVILDKATVSNYFVAYLITILIVNLTEFIVTIYTSIKVNKGQHVEWWFYGDLTNKICKP
jgi:uncharacterized Tic20 family protein